MKTELIEQLDNGTLDFGSLERMLWLTLLESFLYLMCQLLESLDQYLAATRDEQRYELRDMRPRTVRTLLGAVRFRRRYYVDRHTNTRVYLLDERLNLSASDRVSPGLTELMATWAVRGPSYRDVRDRIEALFGKRITSHETVRQVTIEVGHAISALQANEQQTAEGERVVEALFIELDGLYCSYQGRKGRKGRKQESKLAVVHEGWRVRSGSGEKADYALVNTSYCCRENESAEMFLERLRHQICAKYKGVDEIPVIINGDGAEWIKRAARVFKRGIYQYDRFHFVRDLKEALGKHEGSLQRALNALEADDIGSVAIEVLDCWKTTTNAKDKELLDKLRVLLSEHSEAIRDYRVRLREQGYIVNKDWRSMGSAESNVSKFKNRVSKRGYSWSHEGLQAMLVCLCDFHGGVLQDRITRVAVTIHDWIWENVTTSAKEIAEAIGSGWQPPQGGIPTLRNGTRGFAQPLRSMLNVTPI